MKVDPNQAVDTRQECILCQDGNVLCHDGSSTPIDQIEGSANAFVDFCRSLDPNKCFIVALVSRDEDKSVFFRAREVARRHGLHMQAPVETPDRVREMWQAYLQVKSNERLANSAAASNST